MNLVSTAIPDAVLLEPRLFGDERGFFQESYNRRVFRKVMGIDPEFVQDSHSRSGMNVLRGLHYQITRPQGKLVRVVRGSVFDVAVDLRRSSSTFGHWVGAELSEDNHRQFWIPSGFAHGFLVLSPQADVLYKSSDYYAPDYERCIRWDDRDLGIEWPLNTDPVISQKDALGVPFADAEVFE